MSKKYAVVTTIQTFTHKYVISEDRLQSLNPDMPVELEWADDTVVCEDIEEFTQTYLGEQIVETKWMEEDAVLELYDTESGVEHLRDWSDDQKLMFINSGLILDKDKES